MKRLALTLSFLLFSSAVCAEIYQWKDENGKTIISDKPPIGAKRPVRAIDSPEPASSPAQKSLADRDLEFRKRQKESQEGADKAKKEQAAASEKQKNCENAKRALSSLESGERIALRDDKGERYYMSDAQREQEISRARTGVQSNCN